MSLATDCEAVVTLPITFEPAQLTASSVDDSEYPVWVSGTSYAIDALVQRGDKVWVSLIANNLIDPLLGSGAVVPTWLYKERINSQRMFDEKINTETVGTDYIEFTISAGRMTALNLLNVTGKSYSVIMVDSATGLEVFKQESGLANYANIYDFYTWLYEGIEYSSEITVALPPYDTGIVTVRIDSSAGEEAKIGFCSYGNRFVIGKTLKGATVSMRSFSKKITDDFGNLSIKPRAFSKQLDGTIQISTARRSVIFKRLLAVRDIACVYTLVSKYEISTTVGFYVALEHLLDGGKVTTMNLTIEGLT